MGVIKKFNDFGLNESLKEEEQFLIDGSGLFHWNSSLSEETQLEVVKWYNSLDDQQKKYVDILRDESNDKGYEVGAGDDTL